MNDGKKAFHYRLFISFWLAVQQGKLAIAQILYYYPNEVLLQKIVTNIMKAANKITTKSGGIASKQEYGSNLSAANIKNFNKTNATISQKASSVASISAIGGDEDHEKFELKTAEDLKLLGDILKTSSASVYNSNVLKRRTTPISPPFSGRRTDQRRR